MGDILNIENPKCDHCGDIITANEVIPVEKGKGTIPYCSNCYYFCLNLGRKLKIK